MLHRITVDYQRIPLVPPNGIRITKRLQGTVPMLISMLVPCSLKEEALLILPLLLLERILIVIQGH